MNLALKNTRIPKHGMAADMETMLKKKPESYTGHEDRPILTSNLAVTQISRATKPNKSS